jgi:hypothetical protein
VSNYEKSARDALKRINRKKNGVRSAISRLIVELDDLWQSIWEVSVLENINTQEEQAFKQFAFAVAIRASNRKISKDMFDTSLQLAHEGHSEDSEASEKSKFR